MTKLFILSGIIALSSIMAIIFTQKNLKKFIDKNSHFLISFSAGVFLLTACFMAFESLEHTQSYVVTMSLVVFGFILAKLIVFLLPETHHHHDSCCSGHKNSAKKMLLGDSLHNAADGIVLASSYILSPNLLFPLFLAIIIHEILQGISEFFVLKEAGYSTKNALLINFITANTIFIGVILGLYVISPSWHYLIIAISAGLFFNMVYDDLLPHRKHTTDLKKHFAFLVLGGVLIFSLLVLFAD